MTKVTNNTRRYRDHQYTAQRLSRLVVLVCGVAFVAFVVDSCSRNDNENSANSNAEAPVGQTAPDNTQFPETNTIKTLTNALGNSDDLARFDHQTQYHAQLSCLVCHRRDTNASRIGFPGRDGHTPCIGCHTQQFEDKRSPICTICHVNSESGSMKGFPPLRGFGARFDHAKHMRTSCSTCHKPSRRGVALSIPAGRNAHATCFQCHSSKASHSMSTCSLCHQAGRRPRRISESAKAFAVNFSHRRHSSTNCTACHRILRRGSRGKQVTAPIAAMHFPPKRAQSCASCHNNKKAFGGDDFTDCKRCHTGKNFSL